MQLQRIDGQRIVREYNQIGQFTCYNRALILLLERLPCGIYSNSTQCLIRCNPVFGSKLPSAGCEPIDCYGYQMQRRRRSDRRVVMEREADAPIHC
ncbi:hypothetical protein D3C81_2038960 [compost metagenome]